MLYAQIRRMFQIVCFMTANLLLSEAWLQVNVNTEAEFAVCATRPPFATSTLKKWEPIAAKEPAILLSHEC